MKQLHKHPFRRTVALLLTVCCLLSLAVPTAFAETSGNTAVAQTFKFHSYTTANVMFSVNNSNATHEDPALYRPEVTSGDGQWLFVGRSMGSFLDGETPTDLARIQISKSNTGYSPVYFKTESGKQGSWVAFQLENVTAGTYDFALTTKQNNGGGKADVYIMPTSAYSAVATAYSQYDANNTETVTAISDAMKTLLAGIDGGTVSNAKKFETVFDTKEAQTDALQNLGSYTASENGNYVLVFRCAADGAGTVNIKTLSITPSQENQGGGSAGNPLDTIIDHTTLIEATAYEIEFGQNDSFTTSEVNGHDYLYLPHNSILFVYDLDTWTKVDEERIGFSETDGAFVDSSGIVWITGSGKKLYRYNPVDGTGQAIEVNPINKETADEYIGHIGKPVEVNGKLYFGTYPNARLFALDMTSLTYEDLGTLDPDGVYIWSLAYKDGYLYAPVQAANKNSLPQKIVKYSIDGKNVVDSIDLKAEEIADLYVTARNFDDLIVVEDMLLFCSMFPTNTLAIDISGEQMAIATDVQALNGAHNGFSDIVVEADGSKTVYFFAYAGERYKNEETGVWIPTTELWKYNSSTGMSKVDGFERTTECLGSRGDTFVTIQNDEKGLDGTYLVSLQMDGAVSLYDLENKKVYSRLTGLTDNDGAPINAIELAPGPEGSNKLYVGYFMNRAVSEFDITTNAVTKQIPVYSDQTERILWHNGTCYVATYGACAISEVNFDTGAVNNLFQLNKGNSYYIIGQERLRNLVVGGNKIFASTVPHKSILGGFITWYDYDTQNVYVAVEPEKVIYAQAADTFNETTTWRDAKTNEVIVPNLDDYGNHDYTGLIDGQMITSLVYKNGYLYGTTNINGGSGADPKEGASAVVFVYDVENMKLVATCDLREKIDGLADPIVYLAGVWADPDVEGKFWGVASQTLYSFTFDLDTKTFDVQERLSYGKEVYKGVNSEDHSWPVFFADGYMFINFRSKDSNGNPICQFRIVSTDDPTYNVRFSTYPYQDLVLGEDNNIYANVDDGIVKVETAMLFEQLKAAKPAYDQEKAAAAKEKIDSIGTVTLNSEAAITAARTAYNALSVEQKKLVDPTALLTAEAELAALKAAEKAAADQAAADAVKTKIAAIGTITLDSKEAIDAARAAYDALTADQKALVDTTALTAAEAKYAELKAAADKTAADKAVADAAKAKIDAIGTVTLDSKAAIDAARAAYDALTTDQKALVDAAALTAAETKYAELKAAADKTAADKAAVDAAKAKIDAIGTVTLDSKAAIDAARAAYDALTADQKALVDAAALTTAEAKYAELKAAAEKAAADQAAADAVKAKIDAIGTVTLDSKAAIDAARAAYDALTADQKALVDTSALTAAEAKYAELKAAADKATADQAAADAVKAKIDDIGEVSLGSKADIDIARAAYDALSADQKALVDTTVLTAAEARYAELKAVADKAAADQAAADAVKAKIEAVGTVTLKSKDAIDAARAAYNALTADQKALVDTGDLTAAEAKYAELKAAADKAAADQAAADAVKAKIEAIGTVTLDSKDAIDAACAAYDALTADQKKLVNTAALTAAETKYAQLKAAAEEAAAKEAADKTAADAVKTKLDAIGTVTLDSKAAIEAARAAYDALTADQKKLVDTTVLIAAEAKYAELKAAEAAQKLSAAKDEIGKTVSAMTVTNDITKEAAQKAFSEALKKAGITDVDVVVTELAVKKATTEVEGTITVTLTVTSGDQTKMEVYTKPIAKLTPAVDPENPVTGDGTSLLLLTVLLSISLTGIVAVVCYRNKFRNQV